MIETEELIMYGDLEELDFEQKPRTISLFDGQDELTVSGNEDLLDSVKSVCTDCGGVNGEHHIDCMFSF